MADELDRLTDKELEKLEKQLHRLYKEASESMQETIDNYFLDFAKRDAQMKATMEAGEITKEQYSQWRIAQIGRGKRFEALRDKLAERMTKANEVAAAYVNDVTPGVYTLNMNYTAYEIEQGYGSIGFTLWDEETVRRLALEEPELMPYYPEKLAVKRGIDLAYGAKQITAQVTSSILLGDSVYDIADKLQTRIEDMGRTSAVRTARTAFTAAQNGGRQASYERAADMGIKVRKRWIATKDMRTRHEHGAADGQTVAYDEPFTVGGEKLMFPGDRTAASGWNIYNCRCSTRTVEKEGIEAEPRMMRVRDPVTGRNKLVNVMSYSDWKEWKEAGKKPLANTENGGIIKKITNDEDDTTMSMVETMQAARKVYGKADAMNYNVVYGDIVGVCYERRVKIDGKWESSFGVVEEITIPKNESKKTLFVKQLPEGKEQRLDFDATKNTIFSNGRVAVNYRTGNNEYRTAVSSMIGNEIDVLGGIREDGIFYRVTENKKDAEYIKKGTIRPSTNHATGEKEDGLSVWERPKYIGAYMEKVTGEVVGIGSDGEPLLDVKTVKLVEVDGVYEEVVKKRKAGRELFKQKYKWSDEQIDAALTGKFSINR